MQLAKVIGTVVSTRKEPSLNGVKFLLVRPVDEEGRESGNPLVAADAVGAGVEEIVMIASGSSARQTRLRLGDTGCESFIPWPTTAMPRFSAISVPAQIRSIIL